jgi:hypothetical protein
MGMTTGFDAEKMRDVLDAMSARDLEHMRELISRRLVMCVVCNSDGADMYRVLRVGKATYASMAFCPACFERHRLPELRSEE